MAASASIPASISAQSASNPAASKGASAPLAPEMVEEYSSSGGAGNLKKVKRKSPRIRGSCSAGNVEKRPQQQQQPLQPQQPVKEALSPSVAESIRAVFAAFVWHEGTYCIFPCFYFRKKIFQTVYSFVRSTHSCINYA